MSRLRLTQIATPTNPPASTGEIFYSSTLSPAGMAWVDENGVVRRLSPQTVKLTSDLAGVTTTTLANTTNLALTVVTGVYYKFEFGVVWQGATATTGLKIGLTTPSFTRYAATVSMQVAADGTAAEWTGALTTSGDSVIGSGEEATTTDYVAWIRGIILPSAGGTLQVQHAAEVAAAGAITVRQGSHGILWEL